MLAVRPSVLCLALTLFACESSEPSRDVVTLGQGQDPSTGVSSPANPGDSGSQPAPDAAACVGLEESARVLLETHRTCTFDADCRDEAIAAPCPAPFSCNVFVRKDTDVLWSDMKALENKQTTCGGACAVARCATRATTRAYCDATKHCAGREVPGANRPAIDAAMVPSASADAGVGDASAPNPGTITLSDAGSSVGSQYACKVNLDCVITNVGNCCGYYPRCANVNATFAQPSCTGGQAGVCGFPSIDSCECRQNSCVSLQAGNPI